MDRDRDVISMVAAILDCVSSSVGVDGYESFDALMASQRAVGCRAALKEIDKPPVSDEQKRAILDEDEAWKLHLRHLTVSPPVERAGDVERVPAQ
ncbi:MAG: hypothetical protein N0C91_19660 [Candidatus Thiodiazotropha endolucinida]|nr:hypothetical protein [Candidatus Thiodiazotropha taylori]MCG8121242.1 hypothetical protein [Candidatus Thiodiazotropha taylori]MCW4289918.1 hypothetical protein [Candidatus Thiodiazotropha endolucinida]MCW4296935.1 hypothetical protein [Candidatus Thiodiazotropha endolucinida]